MKHLKKKSSAYQKAFLPLTLFLVFSVFFFRSYLFPKETEALQKKESEVRVASDFDVALIPVVSKDIAEGEEFGEAELVRIKWPKQYLVGSVVTELSELKGKRSALRVAAFSPIPTSAIVAKTHQRNSVVQQIPEGMRAVGIKVDSESAVEGWARPGSRVDVIVLYEQAPGTRKVAAKVIAENIVVLSAGGAKAAQVGSSIGISNRIPRTVTLLVSQRDALEIKTASSMGRLTLSLRGASDVVPTTDLKMNRAGLVGESVLSSKGSNPFRGFAKGPNGERYILDNRNRWVSSRSSSLTLLSKRGG